MAGLIEFCESGGDHDTEAFRFKLAHIDYELDTASMSRRRQINPDSSFSVLG